MDYSKILYVKYDDAEQVTETISDIMKNDDMELARIDGNQYIFDRNGDYKRTIIIKEGLNGWKVIADEDTDRTEELGILISSELSCFVLCMSIYKGVLSYFVFNQGEQTDQYMSSLKNYEYEVDDEIREMYSGSVSAFNGVIGEEDTDELQAVIDGCREGSIEIGEASLKIQKLMGVIDFYQGQKESADEKEQEEPEQDGQDEDLFSKMFYVDFMSINIRAEDNKNIIEAIRDICESMGYSEVNEFPSDKDQKKGFLRKILNSVKEEKRIEFFVSPASDGWVTLVGELEKQFGGEPSEWEFLHIEDKLSEALETRTVLIYADSEAWGFSIFEAGKEIYEYASSDESVFIEDINEVLPDMNEDQIKGIFDREILSAQDVDVTFQDFCHILGLKNFRINIPMDLSNEEFLKDIVGRLPDGEQFISMKFTEAK